MKKTKKCPLKLQKIHGYQIYIYFNFERLKFSDVKVSLPTIYAYSFFTHATCFIIIGLLMGRNF
jgi:hypothetical protein